MKICLTTFVQGDQYQEYLPMVIYSIGKAYPEYDVKIFVYRKLRDDIRKMLEIIRPFYSHFEIYENTFDDCPQMNHLIARSLRWVLWDESYKDYDYLYTIDIDMFYIREPKDLMSQHIEHMNYIGSDCTSNIRRIAVLRKTPFEILRIFKWGGVRGVYDLLMTDRVNRMSGLHFVKVKEYYEHITPDIRNKYKNIIYQNNIIKIAPLVSCEPLLYNMMEEGGIDMSVFGIQSSSISMLDFENPQERGFCPHHGIHFGLFRMSPEAMTDDVIAQLEHRAYKYYVEIFKQEILKDLVFKEIYKSFPPRLKMYFQRMFQYYNLKHEELN